MLNQTIVIAGDVILVNEIQGDLELDDTIDGECGAFYVVMGKSEYIGPYETVSLANEDRILETADKMLYGNILVHEIPYVETPNEAGGITVDIG